MNNSKVYTFSINRKCILFSVLRLNLFFLFLLVPTFCLGQNDSQYDQVTVDLSVPGIGKAEIPALIKGNVAYLSISDVFNLIKIKNNTSNQLDSLSGFFINTQDEYLIDRVEMKITFQGKKRILMSDDLILTENILYMKTSLFGEVFGLDCFFDFRNLRVDLTTKLELPLIREMRIEQMRDNLKRLKGEVKTDTIIGRSYPLFKFGVADWSINAYQYGEITSDSNMYQKMLPTTKFSLNLGSVVAGGEFNIGIYDYDPTMKIYSNQKSYIWRYVNNDFKFLRQISVGKMSFQPVSSVLSIQGSGNMSFQSVPSITPMQGSLIGIQLTNTPTILRRSFGTYTKTGYSKPDWKIELYLNNVLVDFVKADASGFYKFEVPMVYGNSLITIRSYGPWGEIETETQNTNIPFIFLPAKEFEYTINTGVLEDSTNIKFFRYNGNYGISRKISVGGGYEYYSSPNKINSLPFISSSAMLFSNLLIASEYTFGVRMKNSLNYRLSSGFQVDMYHTFYQKEQNIIPGNLKQESGLSISLPIQGKHLYSYFSFSFGQIVDVNNDITKKASFLYSGYFYGISSNISTNAMFPDPVHINATTNISLSFRLPGKIRLMPSTMYDYKIRQLNFIGCNLQMPISRSGYLSASYKHLFKDKTNTYTVGLIYDFSFMQTGLNTTFNKIYNTFNQTARGSILFDRKNKYIGAFSNNAVGNSGLTFSPFLDLNGNGKRDKNEPSVHGLNLRINGGRIVKSKKDSIIRVVDLQPYTSYLVELDKNSLKSISWQIDKLNLSVFADPNQIKTIEIPIKVMAEASGIVNLMTKNGTRGQSRVYVNFYRDGKTLSGKVLTEEDGYYSYMGLLPGEYVARMDSIQLRKIKMAATPEFKTFTVKQSREGDFVEGIDFTLFSNSKDTAEPILPKVDSSKIKIINYASTSGKEGAVAGVNKPELRAESTLPGVRFSQGFPGTEKPDGKNTGKQGDLKLIGKGNATIIRATDRYAQSSDAELQRCSIQFGEYKSEMDAVADQRTITTTTGLPVIIVLEGDVYKLWIEGFNSRREARAFLASVGKTEVPINVDRDIVAMNKVKDEANAVSKNKVVSDKVTKINNIENPAGKNQLIDYTDSIANIFKFEPEGSKTRGYPVKAKQPDVTKVDSKPSTKIGENQNDQLSVVGGGNISIQIDGFIFDKSATAALRRISIETKLPIIISIKDGFYNLLIKGFASRREAKLFEEKLAQMGFKGSIVRGNS